MAHGNPPSFIPHSRTLLTIPSLHVLFALLFILSYQLRSLAQAELTPTCATTPAEGTCPTCLLARGVLPNDPVKALPSVAYADSIETFDQCRVACGLSYDRDNQVMYFWSMYTNTTTSKKVCRCHFYCFTGVTSTLPADASDAASGFVRYNNDKPAPAPKPVPKACRIARTDQRRCPKCPSGGRCIWRDECAGFICQCVLYRTRFAVRDPTGRLTSCQNRRTIEPF